VEFSLTVEEIPSIACIKNYSYQTVCIKVSNLRKFGHGDGLHGKSNKKGNIKSIKNHFICLNI